MARDLCIRCLTSAQACYCGELTAPLRSRIQFVILQHPLERKRTVGTARMAHRCLEHSVLREGPGEIFDTDPVVQGIMSNPDNHCVVLYPGPKASNISVTPDREWLPEGKNCVVFVIDGTWPHARTMLNRSKTLQALPQISFNPNRRSEYRFRRQPDPRCLSTIEAIHEVLTILDPQVESSLLMTLFRNMVERQLVFKKPGVFRRVSRSTRSAPEELSPSPQPPLAT